MLYYAELQYYKIAEKTAPLDKTKIFFHHDNAPANVSATVKFVDIDYELYVELKVKSKYLTYRPRMVLEETVL